MQLLLSSTSFAAPFRRACDFAERGMSSRLLKCMPYDRDEIDEGWTSLEVTSRELYPGNYLLLSHFKIFHVHHSWPRLITNIVVELSARRNPRFPQREVVSAERLEIPGDKQKDSSGPRRGSSVSFEDEMTVSRCRSFRRSSRFTEAAWCHGVLYFAYRRPDADSSFSPAAFQECECHRFSTAVTTVSEDDDDLRPADRLCTPANRYTFYALRLVCRFRSFFFPERCSEYHMWACLSFVKLPVETLFLC